MKSIAVVTGGNRGIGKEVCRQLAEKGYVVYLCSRDLAKGEAAARDLGLDGVIPAQLDVTDQVSVDQLKAQVEQEQGRLDALVNNAAINYDTWQRTLSADIDNVKETMETNLYGPWRMAMAFAPLLRLSDHPRIVNVSSGSGSLTDMGSETPAYGISKAALNALTIKLAGAMRSDNVLVNAVCPGWIATDMGGPGGGPIEPGGESVVWAAVLPDDGPTGGFFRHGKRINL
ncbi:MAG: SDR family NAD(P)-dependent oxidoreductase [Chloroflexota bacterium]